jgi:hypothetical protein
VVVRKGMGGKERDHPSSQRSRTLKAPRQAFGEVSGLIGEEMEAGLLISAWVWDIWL